AVPGREYGFEHQRIALVAPLHGVALVCRHDLPAAVVQRAEQGGEAGARIEMRHAQPVDRAVPPDERAGEGVADERVVLDRELMRLRHRPFPANMSLFKLVLASISGPVPRLPLSTEGTIPGSVRPPRRRAGVP